MMKMQLGSEVSDESVSMITVVFKVSVPIWKHVMSYEVSDIRRRRIAACKLKKQLGIHPTANNEPSPPLGISINYLIDKGVRVLVYSF